jgi:hypothetical protein
MLPHPIYFLFPFLPNCVVLAYQDQVLVCFHASAATLMRPVLFWDITRRRVVIVHRRFGTMYRSHLLGLLTLEDETDTLSRNVGKQLPHDAV